MDRPQWHIYVQPNYNGEEAVLFIKLHHSIADGISGMNLTLQCDDIYDPDKLIKMPSVPVYKRMIYRLISPFMIPIILYEALTEKIIVNPIHDGKRELTGVKKCVISELFSFEKIKKSSKVLKVTINDLLTSALSVGFKRFFQESESSYKD